MIRKRLAIALMAIASCRVRHSQTAAGTRAFEAVSIKPSPPPGRSMMQGTRGGPGTRDPGLFTTENFSVSNLLQMAYSVDWYRISGPEWMKDARFNIAARVPAGATQQQLRLMLQTMLVERFGLKVHHESKEAPGYALVAAKNGPRFTPSSKATTAADDGQSLPDTPPAIGPPTLDKDGFPIIPAGSRVSARGGPDGRRTQKFDNESMEEFAHTLSENVGRPVKDATGLKGEYDFTLRWVADQAGREADDVAPRPTIFEALQQQLGLKLEPAKTQIDVLVIDHIEKTPTEN
jgi:uncharacterized protein (TIGR03435 family)